MKLVSFFFSLYKRVFAKTQISHGKQNYREVENVILKIRTNVFDYMYLKKDFKSKKLLCTDIKEKYD